MRKVLFLLLCGILSLVTSDGWCQFWPPASSTETGIVNQILQRIGTPVFDVSWAATGSITARASATGTLSQSFLISPFEIDEFLTSGNGDGKLVFDARGLWLGVTIPVRLTDSLIWSTQAEYFVPFRNRIWASANGTNFRSETDIFAGVPSGPFTSSQAGDLELNASVRTTWFFIDTEIAYSGLSEGTSILVGVRYDRLLASIGPVLLPSNITIPVVPASVTAELNSVCPYVGLRTSLGGPTSGITFEIKGLPTVVFTNARYKAQNGYFGEFKGEYYGPCPFANNLSMSVFVKGDIIHAAFAEPSDFTRLFTLQGDMSFTPGGPTGSPLIAQNSSSEVATSVHWSQLSFGGSLVLSF
jgi:hypothetical protein